jgi:hypothetical protein
MLSCLVAAVDGDTFLGDVKPQAWIFDGVLTVRVPGTGSPRAQLSGAQECLETGYEVGP